METFQRKDNTCPCGQLLGTVVLEAPFERLHSFLTWQLTNISDRKLMFHHNLQDLSSIILYTARVKSVVGRLWVADLLLEPSCYWYFVNKIWINLSLVITEKIQIFISDGIEFNFRIITNGDKSILLIQNSWYRSGSRTNHMHIKYMYILNRNENGNIWGKYLGLIVMILVWVKCNLPL